MDNAVAIDSSIIVKDDAFIQSIIDAIPPKYYFDRDVLEQLEDAKVKTADEDYKGLYQRKHFGLKAKHIRHKLNPLHQKTVSQIVSELDAIERKNDQEYIISPRGNSDELQQRLKSKIEVLKAKRKGSDNKQEHRLKRKIAKLKQKEKQKKKKYTKVNETLFTDKKNGNVKSNSKTPNVFNKEGKLIYSKFDLGDTTGQEYNKKPQKSILKKSLKELKKKEEKIQKLEEESSEKAEEFKKKSLWQQALNKSEGLKVKDNPELLKKTMKRQEQRKKKSQKQWQNRTEQLEKKKQERQEKRTSNIQNRKNSKLNNKLKKASKKGRLIPGF